MLQVELPSMASKLCDMGVSTLLKTGGTTLRGPRGTQEFMSPEMFAFNAHITKATDIWSFGVVLIELFGRQQVWQGMVAQQIVGALSGGYNRPPQGPDRKHLEESVRVIVDKCLTLDPDSRPPLEDIIVLLLSLLETPLEGKEGSKEGN